MLIWTAAAALAAQTPAPVAAELGDIRMHLYYNRRGELSEDISPPNQFAGWNTTIDADDLLIVAEVRTTGEQFVSRPLRIVARRAGRILGQRRFGSMLTSDAGRAYLPLWLNDVTCGGEVQVTVTFGSETKTETVTFECGE
jgi:hypothetical protein